MLLLLIEACAGLIFGAGMIRAGWLLGAAITNNAIDQTIAIVGVANIMISTLALQPSLYCEYEILAQCVSVGGPALLILAVYMDFAHTTRWHVLFAALTTCLRVHPIQCQ